MEPRGTSWLCDGVPRNRTANPTGSGVFQRGILGDLPGSGRHALRVTSGDFRSDAPRDFQQTIPPTPTAVVLGNKRYATESFGNPVRASSFGKRKPNIIIPWRSNDPLVLPGNPLISLILSCVPAGSSGSPLEFTQFLTCPHLSPAGVREYPRSCWRVVPLVPVGFRWGSRGVPNSRRELPKAFFTMYPRVPASTSMQASAVSIKPKVSTSSMDASTTSVEDSIPLRTPKIPVSTRFHALAQKPR